MKGLPAFQLYKLESDPSEENNLAENHPEKVKELQSLLEHYVTSGRSTPGTPQKNDGPPMWPQLNWMDSRPNVIIVITDDQGYGDLGCHGNEIIRTPHLDQFYSESVHLTNFHVSPTCAPTRAALMRSDEHTSELQTLMRSSNDVFSFKKKIRYRIKTR